MCGCVICCCVAKLWVLGAALANLCSGDSGDAVSEAINASHKLLAANFVYGASHTFDQIIYTGALQYTGKASGLA